MLAPRRVQVNVIRGAWWPTSLDLDVELPGLLRLMSAHIGPLRGVSLNRNAWNPIALDWSPPGFAPRIRIAWYGQLFAQVLPPIMLASLTAILLAGFLNWVGKRLPRLTGEGRLQPGVEEELTPGEEKAAASAVDPAAIAARSVPGPLQPRLPGRDEVRRQMRVCLPAARMTASASIK